MKRFFTKNTATLPVADPNLTATTLVNNNQIWVQQSQRLGEDEIIKQFLQLFNKYLKQELRRQRSVEVPQSYLVQMSKLGAFSITVYQGFFPKDHEQVLLPFIRKELTDVFSLKNFQGFRLVFNYKEKVDNFCSIDLCWNDGTFLPPPEVLQPEPLNDNIFEKAYRDAELSTENKNHRHRHRHSKERDLHHDLKKIKRQLRAIQNAQYIMSKYRKEQSKDETSPKLPSLSLNVNTVELSDSSSS